MNQRGSGNGSVLGTSTTAAGTGILMLPNTGSNSLLTAVAVTSIFIGLLIVLTTIIRFAAKKYYKA